MKKLLLFFALALSVQITNAQEKYTIDNGSIVVSKVVENIDADKDAIYARVKSYFVSSYGDANSVIQTDDKDGGLVIGKGLYLGLASFALGAWQLKAYHILRVDIKDSRVRIICNATTIIPNSSAHLGNEYEYRIIDYYPITSKRQPQCMKKAQEEAFNNLVELMNQSVASLADAIIGGGTLEAEKSDW